METQNNIQSLKDVYTGKIYGDEDVLNNAPTTNDQNELEFFNLEKKVTNDELEEEYIKRGLVPVDPHALASWNEANRDDDRRYFATHWKDKEGQWCFSAFFCWPFDPDHPNDIKRYVRVGHYLGEWGSQWYFGGIKKLNKTKHDHTY